MVDLKKIKLILILSVILSTVGILILYLSNLSILIETYLTYEGAIGIILIITLRIFIMSLMTIYMFRTWFKAEHQFFDDTPFLFALFFLILTFGKTIDLFWDFTYYSFSSDLVLLLIKFRFVIIVVDLAPLLYIGLGIILFSLSSRYKKLGMEKYSNKIRIQLIVVIIIIELFAIILGSDILYLNRLLTIILIPSLIAIVYIFYIAYKGKRLSQVNPLILSLGFLLLMISNIFRPIATVIIGESANLIILVESIDLIIFLIIFIGCYKEIDYSNG